MQRRNRAEKALPGLLDNARLRSELGITKAAADRIMRALPTVEFEGLRKVYVRRDDVSRLIDYRTFSRVEVPRTWRTGLIEDRELDEARLILIAVAYLSARIPPPARAH
jgi:hypothetical protein